LKQISKRLTYANVMSSLAVFLILGGATAFAAVKKVGANEIKANSIKTGKLVKEAVTAGKIKAGAITESRIADKAVTTNKLGDNAVTTPKIAKEAVTAEKIAKEAVTTEKIAKNAVNSEKLADNAVTTTKIAANAVTQQKLAGSSVGSAQLKDITVVGETSASVNNGESVGVTATCPSGVAIAGGFETAGAGAAKWVVKRLLRSGNGWRVFGTNESGGASTIIAFVYCLST
jgi:hypothetical protein